MSQIPVAAGKEAYVSFSNEVNQKTTDGLLGALAQLVQQGFTTIHLMLSTGGGNVMNGMTLYNTLRALPVKLITYNMGNVDSIGNVIFLAGEERYCAKHATFMFHGVAFQLPGATICDMKMCRERLSSMEADEHRIASVLVDRTKLDSDEVGKLFLEGKTRSPEFALEKGLVHGVKDISVPQGVPLVHLVF